MRPLATALGVLIALALTGCSVTDTSRYYALGSTVPPGETQRPTTEAGATIGVGPIAVPGYLDRPQLVTRDAAGALEIWPYHRWAEPLETGIAEALAEVLSAKLPNDRVAVFPWRGMLARVLEYQVAVAVARFEGSPGGTVILDARWRLLTRDGRELAFKRTIHSEPVDGEGFAPVVAAMNRSIAWLGGEISDAIQSQATGRAAIRN